MTEHADLVAFCELTQAQARFRRTLDTKDWNGLPALMVDDIEFGMSDGESEPHMTVGRNETLALLTSLVAGARTAHQVHSPEIDLDEDEAQVIWAGQDRAAGYARPPHVSSHRFDSRLKCAPALASAAAKTHYRVDPERIARANVRELTSAAQVGSPLRYFNFRAVFNRDHLGSQA